MAVSTTCRPAGRRCACAAYPLLGPNGVGLAPDGRACVRGGDAHRRLWAWELAGPGEIVPAAGSLAPGGGVCVAATPFSFDSLAVEEDGRVVIGALPDGLVAVTPDGKEVDVYPVPGDAITNIAFGGADGRRAVITASLTGASRDAGRAGIVVSHRELVTPPGPASWVPLTAVTTQLNELGFYTLAGAPKSPAELLDEVPAGRVVAARLRVHLGALQHQGGGDALSGAVGAVSSTLGVATAATNHNTRHPVVTASFATTMHRLTGGRFTLGLGRGIGPLFDA